MLNIPTPLKRGWEIVFGVAMLAVCIPLYLIVLTWAVLMAFKSRPQPDATMVSVRDDPPRQEA